MNLALNIVLLLVGFAALIKGADLFVDGSSQVAKRLHVSSVIIGLTIVAMGTSAPELAVSTAAAIKGSNEIALSNVIGSNLFNQLAVIGITAIINLVPVDKSIIKRDFPVTILATLFLLIGAFVGSYKGTNVVNAVSSRMDMNTKIGVLGRISGIILLICFCIYLYMLIRDAKKKPVVDEETKLMPVYLNIIFIIVGIAVIIIGGQLVVNNAKEIALRFGMSETLVGLTIVAVGTSLPELVTSVVASRKGENGLAIGNVIGSSIFNILLILGISSTINPIAVNFASGIDLIILLVVSLIMYIFGRSAKTVNRIEGIILLLIYVGTMIFAIIR